MNPSQEGAIVEMPHLPVGKTVVVPGTKVTLKTVADFRFERDDSTRPRQAELTKAIEGAGVVWKTANGDWVRAYLLQGDLVIERIAEKNAWKFKKLPDGWEKKIKSGMGETTTSGVVPDISGGSVMGSNRPMNTGPGVSCPVCGKKCKRGKCPKHGQMYEAVLAKDVRARGKVYKKGLKVKPLMKLASGKYNVMLAPGITTIVTASELVVELEVPPQYRSKFDLKAAKEKRAARKRKEAMNEARIRAGKDQGEYVVMLVATNDTYYWTGKEWTTKRESAEVYKDMRTAANAIQVAKVKGKSQATVEGE